MQLELFAETSLELFEIESHEAPSPIPALFVLSLSTLAMVALIIAPHRIGMGL